MAQATSRKPRDDNTKRKAELKRGGTTQYTTGSGQGMMKHRQGSGDQVEYQTGGGGNLSNYIDKILGMSSLGGGGAASDEFPPAPLPNEAPLPTGRPEQVEVAPTTGDPDEQKIKEAIADGYDWSDIAAGAGAAGILGAAALALYRLQKHKGRRLPEIQAAVGDINSGPQEREVDRSLDRPIRTDVAPLQSEAEERRLLRVPNEPPLRLPAPDASEEPRQTGDPEADTSQRRLNPPPDVPLLEYDADGAAQRNVETGEGGRPSTQRRFPDASDYNITDTIDEQVGEEPTRPSEAGPASGPAETAPHPRHDTLVKRVQQMTGDPALIDEYLATQRLSKAERELVKFDAGVRTPKIKVK